LELDLSVGSLDGALSFGRLRDVSVRRGGGLWTLDSQGRRVRGFDETGNEALAFGRPGQGPGEFTAVEHVEELASGDLLVATSGPITLHQFRSDGEHLTSWVVPDSLFRDTEVSDSGAPQGPTFGRWRLAPDGTPFVHTVVIRPEDDRIVRRDVLLRIDRGGEGGTRLTEWRASVMESGPGGALQLMMPDAAWVPLPDGGAWWTGGEEYRLHRIRADGSVVQILSRPWQPRPVDAGIRNGVVGRLGTTMNSPFERDMLERAVFPEHLPAIYGLWASYPSGRLWVGVFDSEATWDYEHPNAWDIFEPDGLYVGRLSIPVGFRTTRITDDHVVGIWRDELDVSHARRYRIIRSAR
jgi:hypothetical protein